jgi:hypothetical protein
MGKESDQFSEQEASRRFEAALVEYAPQAAKGKAEGEKGGEGEEKARLNRADLQTFTSMRPSSLGLAGVILISTTEPRARAKFRRRSRENPSNLPLRSFETSGWRKPNLAAACA